MKANWIELGNTKDDYKAEDGHFILRVEQMDVRIWWWKVYYKDDDVAEGMEETKFQAMLAAEMIMISTKKWRGFK